MAQAGVADPYDVESVHALGVIDLPAIQRKVNLHYSLTLDLFGSEESTNAANFFNAGIKGRYHENRLDDDHQLRDTTYPVMKLVDGELQLVDVPALNGLNARLRDDFIDDCMGGIKRWNKEIESHGIEFEITLPHVAFNRAIGEFGDLSVTPDGLVVTEDARGPEVIEDLFQEFPGNVLLLGNRLDAHDIVSVAEPKNDQRAQSVFPA